MRIALVGDYRPDVVAHQGIDRSLSLAAALHPALSWEWVATPSIGVDAPARLREFTGVWLVPASPYADEAGALASVTYARINQIPFLGTCGGFQHALIEFAREVIQLHDAGHAETQPNAFVQFISPLACSLVEQKGTVHLAPGTRLREIYGKNSAEEGYHCSYGLNPRYAALFEGPSAGRTWLKIAARDTAGEVRAVELAGHPFFIATLFQPERRALSGQLHPVVRSFIEAAR